MIAAWLLFPLVALVVCLGCGLAVQRLGGWDLPGATVLPIGLTLVIVIATLSTDVSALAPLTTPIVLVVALAGYVVGRRRLRGLAPDGWAIAVGVGVFAVCAAPVVVSGNATFLGYFVLNDGVFHFSLIDQLLHHGRDISAVPPSSYQALLSGYLSTSYPTGADLPIGVLRPLVGQDVAWLFQPEMAIMMAFGGLAVHDLLRDVIESRPLRALAAFVAAQAGLLFAYYLEGSIKEVATTWLITLTVVLVFATLRAGGRLRAVIPLAVVALAGLDVLDLAIAPWLVAPLAAFVITVAIRARYAVRRIPRRRLAIGAGAAALVLAAIAAPIIQRVSTFIAVDTAVLTQKGDLGNLIQPLTKWQMTGIWPAGDFRLPQPSHIRLTFVLIGIELAGAAMGTVWALRTRRYPPLLLLAGNAVAAAYLLSRGSPYADGKVMMIMSLTVVMTGTLGAAALHDGGRRIEAWGLVAAIAAGVLWTNVLGYHDASVAPRARLAELSAIGRRFSGRGPAFYNMQDEFGAYFLRETAPIDVSLSGVAPRPGAVAPPGRQPWDLDAIPLSYVERQNLLVIGNAAGTSRPPANFRLADQGRYDDVWQRTASPTVLVHVPLGGPLNPAARPSCRLVRRVAAEATRDHARLAYAPRPPIPTLIPTAVPHGAWPVMSDDPDSVITQGSAPGSVTGNVQVPAAGRYQLDVSGDVGQQLDLYIDGRHVGWIADQLGPPGQITPVTEVTLAAGRHLISVVRPAGDLSPGVGGLNRTLGPVMLVGGQAIPPVSTIAPSAARSLCGRTLDWLEVVR